MKQRISIYLLSVILMTIVSCSSSKSVSNSSNVTTATKASNKGRDGLSYESAIIVRSIKEEYQWIGATYPGSNVEMQALVRKQGKPYDVLTFTTKEGDKRKAYFDISKFFGKGF